MATLTSKIDFAVVVSVKNANPNGDPLNGNRPRTNYDGYGELSDVCIKRKIRNRLLDAKHSIFVQSDDYRIDGYRSLRERAEGELKNVMNNEDSFRETACKKWIDVRAFGQVFAFSGGKKGKGKGKADNSDDSSEDKGVSIGIRGPVSIHPAFSISPISISSIQITKSVSGEGDGSKRASDTMGLKHRVDYGLYVFYGSMNTQLAVKTGFSDEDALAIKQALCNLFENDSSSASPEGSMEVHKVYWWRHNSANGQYSSAKVHHSLSINLKDGVTEAKSIDDYDIIVKSLESLNVEVLDGR